MSIYVQNHLTLILQKVIKNKEEYSFMFSQVWVDTEGIPFIYFNFSSQA